MSKNKSSLHPNSKHQGQYNFELLTQSNPELEPYVHMAKSGRLSIAFSDPQAVKALNKALLFHFYNLSYWDIPDGYFVQGCQVGQSIYIILLIYSGLLIMVGLSIMIILLD